MSKIGFLGYGKIGSFVAENLLKTTDHEISFTCNSRNTFDMVDISLLKQTDLIVETATATILKKHIDLILKYSDLMVFSLTAFADEEFENKCKNLCAKYSRKIYIPHGAIAGIDAIVDGREIIDSVTIETIKSPKSLGLDSMEKSVVYQGPTRKACMLFPRNVNVHAATAMAGIGFDNTISKIVADPSVSTNSHIIHVKGKDIDFKYELSSFASGGVSAAYTPFSALGSVKRVLNSNDSFCFI